METCNLDVHLYLSDESIQFIGDIHQPLHDEGLDLGGNEIDVTFDGSSTNLHHIVSATSSLFLLPPAICPSGVERKSNSNILLVGH